MVHSNKQNVESEREIIASICNGNTRAFAVLVDTYKNRAFTLAMRILKHREDAEDAVQDAFIRCYNALPQFEERAMFSTWLYRIVYNVCISQLRKRNSLVSSVEESENVDAIFQSFDWIPDALSEQNELRLHLHSAIASLPAHYASIFSLFYEEHCSYEQICEITAMPLGTVKTQLFRARMHVRKSIESHYSTHSSSGVTQ